MIGTVASLILLFLTIQVPDVPGTTTVPGRSVLEAPARTEEWTMDMNISEECFASFIGEAALDGNDVHYLVRGAGDVNGDGFNDVLIGANGNDEGGNSAGQSYLIYGKSTGWMKDMGLQNADASFIGEAADDNSGKVSSAGDVNKDGYDDFLIGAFQNDEGGTDAGQAYLFLGKASKWSMDTDIGKADASFIGESQDDWAGYSVDGAGDVNGDGHDDIIIGAYMNDDGGTDAGKAYLVFGKNTGWSLDTDIGKADASFTGEDPGDGAGFSAAGVGDVNGDGYDDVMIGAPYRSNGGEAYLILGRSSGWSTGVSLSNSDASFIAETTSDDSGYSLTGVGDVNGDGYGDILIGSEQNAEGGTRAGQTYLIFGKASGWSMDTDLKLSDATFIGEDAGDASSPYLHGTGDMNCDGLDDLLIGATLNNEGGSYAGQAYVIFGKVSGWTRDTDLSGSDASFIGEHPGDKLGRVAIVGDVDGDGICDFMVAARENDEGGNNAGETYLVAGGGDIGLSAVLSVKTYDDEGSEIANAEMGQTVHVELIGIDANSTSVGVARVVVNSSESFPNGFVLKMNETGPDTGTFRSEFTVSETNDPIRRHIKALLGETIRITSLRDRTKAASLLVWGPVVIRPAGSDITAIEDSDFRLGFLELGYNPVSDWSFTAGSDAPADWLRWDDDEDDLHGTPRNDNVDVFHLNVTAADMYGNSFTTSFDVTVINRAPCITTTNECTSCQDQFYSVDYDCDDEGVGSTIWTLEYPYPDWLSFDRTSGILNGTPRQEDIGSSVINVSVDDGNGGLNWTEFVLTVTDRNDPPEILTVPTRSIEQGSNYFVRFHAIDRDNEYNFTWSVVTDAYWLTFDVDLRELYGMPANRDVGIYFVNVTATDKGGLYDFINYTLEVLDVNDYPEWVAFPEDLDLDQGQHYVFVVEATDEDNGDVVSYRLETDPKIDMTMDGTTGSMEWTASLKGLDPNLDFTVQVTVFASDGSLEIFHWFTIRVIPNPSPTVSLTGPRDGALVPSTGIGLSWEGHDDEEGILYDLYLGDSHSAIVGREKDCQVLERTNVTSLWVDDLVQGRTYYWTVVPRDRFSAGICRDGIPLFRVNSVPYLQTVPDQIAFVGEEMRVSLTGTDPETSGNELEFIVSEGPEDMEITKTVIFLIWTPGPEDVGDHQVSVSLFDGLEYSNISFLITVDVPEIVEEGGHDEGPGAILFVIVGVVVFMVLVGMVLFFFLVVRKKRGTGPDVQIMAQPTTPASGPIPQETPPSVFPPQDQYSSESYHYEPNVSGPTEPGPIPEEAVQPSKIDDITDLFGPVVEKEGIETYSETRDQPLGQP